VTTDPFAAAVAAEVLAAAAARRELLRSIVEVARAIFGARAASIAVLDETAGDFVFEAVAGEGERQLVGARFRAGQGIAGAAAATGEPMVIDDLAADGRFARDVAEETGYVPDAIMVAPLLRGERTLGVLSVLDRRRLRPGLEDLQLLEAFAGQAAQALELSDAARRAEALLDPTGDRPDELAAVAPAIRRLLATEDPDRRAAGLRLLAAVDELLR
jgi:GAF domain-containing protein